jgi:NAD(P)-dependent dehydrogenase (short-subunit alcohol dehydrogenase family)
MTIGKILITGGTMGLGKALSRHFVSQGHDVVICARNQDQIDKTVRELNQLASHNQTILGIPCDISKMESASVLRDVTERKGIFISSLICNAGVIGPIGRFHVNDLNFWLESFQINLNGVVNLVNLFLPYMIKQKFGRVIHISGGGATRPLHGMSSYASSKAAAVRFVETLAVEYQGSGVTFNSIAPGIMKSRMLDEMLNAGEEQIGKNLFEKIEIHRKHHQDSTLAATELIDFLCSESSQGISGKLISAEWDNWREWVHHVKELQQSDVYTLRRVTGRDRGQIWGDKL